ncbi:sulfatase-like hydrolase/transferase [Frisingicoccus sp.]|uniref:sulfatase-like hydrolase/transferase n=1 Tax=Frisingicoccus sp. TaxID=1918627 RepID=UPI00399B3269
MEVSREEKEVKYRTAKCVFRIFLAVLTVLLGTLGVLAYKGIFWMFKTWNNLTMDELVYHLNSPLEGTNQGVIDDFISSCGIITIVAAVVLIAVMVVLLLLKRKWVFYVAVSIFLIISAVLIGYPLNYAWNTLDVASYKDNQGTYSTFIDDNYISPTEVTLTFPEEKRNLIYIYLESMEITYADEESGGAFEYNVIPELTQLSLEYENFSGEENILNGGTSLHGTTWTVAAMFAQTSGLPLLIPMDGNSMNTQDTFFPGITTLGDILETAGYTQGLLIGSEATFGGRELYFTTHGDYNIWDYNYYSSNGSLPEGYRVWWGYEDAYLFEFAKDKLLEMSQEEEPFNLTLLTVDTHFEDGYVCADCSDTYGDDQYANVMACSSQKVAEFIEWVQQQDFYENTTIIISGDHPTMDSDFCEDVDEDYERKVYTAYINAAVRPEVSFYREFSTFDQFPTTLAAIGVQIEGERLGLGTNLFSHIPTLSERFGNDTINSELSKKSLLMEELTADIVDQSLKLEEAAENSSADITATDYNNQTGKFEVYISNIASDMDYQAIRCLAYPEEDVDNQQWYDVYFLGDGTYKAEVYAWDYGFETGNYKVEVYLIDANGDSIMIGEVGGILVR